MTYSIREIADLSINQLSNEELNEALAAFSGFSEIFGRTWIDVYFQGVRSPVFTRSIMAMWSDFELIRSLPNVENVVDRWRYGIRGQGVIAEVRTFAQFVRVGLEIELFPLMHKRVPDGRIRTAAGSPWTYFEVSQRAMSELKAYAEKVMMRVSQVAAELNPGVHAKIAILRVPEEFEVDAILEWLKSGPHSGVELQGLAVLAREPIETGVNDGDVLYQHVGQPRFFTTTIASGLPAKKASVAMAVSDVGAKNMLDKEAQQIPANEPGFLVFDLSSVIGSGSKDWRSLIERRLQPNVHTRVGAVILTECYGSAKGRQSKSEIVVNPHATSPIGADMREKIERAFIPES